MTIKGPTWRFVHFGLIVTGKGERDFLPSLFRALTATGHCTFEVCARVPQLNPRTSAKVELKAVGATRRLPTRDEELGLVARAYIDRRPDGFVMLVDDLEHDWSHLSQEKFARYRSGLDALLGTRAWRAGVFFLVNMLEAYYFADAQAVNLVLGTQLADDAGDVETRRHPKNELKALVPAFHERHHGKEIVGRLDLRHVLDRCSTCASLRALVAWCTRIVGDPPGSEFQLAEGAYALMVGRQLANLHGHV